MLDVHLFVFADFLSFIDVALLMVEVMMSCGHLCHDPGLSYSIYNVYNEGLMFIMKG